MLRTTIGQLMIDNALPPEMRGQTRKLDKKGIKTLMQEVAEKYPERYREIAKNLSDIGRDAAFTTGGYSFGLKSLKRSVAQQRMVMDVGQKINVINNNPNLSDDEREAAIIQATRGVNAKLADDVMSEMLASNNPLARQALSGSRGNKHNLNSLLGADILYTDHTGKEVPIPVLRNYAQGLTPVEYFAGAFGARKGVMDLKTATQDAGFFAKQLVQAAHRLLVTHTDDDVPYDESQPRGYPTSTDDNDSVGALLSHPIGGYDRNTELTPKILKDLRSNGHENILVRSPIVGGPTGGGVFARDVGRRERGRIAPVGDFVGIAAAQALAEPVTQAQISSKHTGGIAGAAGAGAINGFKYINQLVQVPKTFKGGAAHAQTDGAVESVRKAPAGGHFVQVNGEEHYVNAGFNVTVQPGDKVEAGDVLSEGIPNPAEIVRYKGVGEGRRYFINAFSQALNDSGVSASRRNIELLSRGLINHVRLTEPYEGYSPDEVMPYQAIERAWKPRPGYIVVPPNQAVGKYLERPVLHYSIGTQVRPSMMKELEQYGVKQLYAHADPAPFEPEMIRGMETVGKDHDWVTRFLGGYQQKNLLRGVARGDVSNEAGTSYVPALAHGINFGRLGMTQGFKPEPLKPIAPKVDTPSIDLTGM